MIQQRITEKLKILSEQLNVEDRQKIEKELIKMNPSEKSQFDFSCGYSNRNVKKIYIKLTMPIINTGKSKSV